MGQGKRSVSMVSVLLQYQIKPPNRRKLTWDIGDNGTKDHPQKPAQPNSHCWFLWKVGSQKWSEDKSQCVHFSCCYAKAHSASKTLSKAEMCANLLSLSWGSKELISKSVRSLRGSFSYPGWMEKRLALPLQLLNLNFGFKPKSTSMDPRTRSVMWGLTTGSVRGGKKTSEVKSLLRKDAVEDEAVGIFHQGWPQIWAPRDTSFCMLCHYSVTR